MATARQAIEKARESRPATGAAGKNPPPEPPPPAPQPPAAPPSDSPPPSGPLPPATTSALPPTQRPATHLDPRSVTERFEALLQRAQANRPSDDISLIRRAWEFCVQHHEGQRGASGD